MIGVGFLWFGAMLSLWLAIFTVISSKYPDSLPGRVLAVIR